MNYTEKVVYIYNGDTMECHVSPTATYAEQSVFVAAVLRRCDRARLRLRGTGPCCVYAMSRVTRTGAEVRIPEELGVRN